MPDLPWQRPPEHPLGDGGRVLTRALVAPPSGSGRGGICVTSSTNADTDTRRCRPLATITRRRWACATSSSPPFSLPRPPPPPGARTLPNSTLLSPLTLCLACCCGYPTRSRRCSTTLQARCHRGPYAIRGLGPQPSARLRLRGASLLRPRASHQDGPCAAWRRSSLPTGRILPRGYDGCVQAHLLPRDIHPSQSHRLWGFPFDPRPP